MSVSPLGKFYDTAYSIIILREESKKIAFFRFTVWGREGILVVMKAAGLENELEAEEG